MNAFDSYCRQLTGFAQRVERDSGFRIALLRAGPAHVDGPDGSFQYQLVFVADSGRELIPDFQFEGSMPFWNGTESRSPRTTRGCGLRASAADAFRRGEFLLGMGAIEADPRVRVLQVAPGFEWLGVMERFGTDRDAQIAALGFGLNHLSGAIDRMVLRHDARTPTESWELLRRDAPARLRRMEGATRLCDQLWLNVASHLPSTGVSIHQEVQSLAISIARGDVCAKPIAPLMNLASHIRWRRDRSRQLDAMPLNPAHGLRAMAVA